MAARDAKKIQKPRIGGEIGDFDAAARARRNAEWKLSMSERLARVHSLSQQMSAVKGRATAP
jgi:hypothetical protein